jgi:gliding motility-associated lipoprotein GldH
MVQSSKKTISGKSTSKNPISEKFIGKKLTTLSVIPSALVLALAALTSCNNGTILNEFKDVKTSGWASEDTVTFNLPKTTSSADLNVRIGIRSTDDYEYKDLYVTAALMCEGEEISYDTLKINIYDTDGNNNGKGFPYATVTKDAPAIHVDSGLTYTYRICHIMKPNTVKGISCVGLKLEVQ